MLIYLIDDDATLRRGLGHFLEAQGHRVTHFSDGNEVWPMLRKVLPDLVISDVQMPGMDGLTLMSHINDHQIGVPVLIMTAFATVEDAVYAMQNGAVDYLTKPLDLKTVGVKIRRVEQELQLKQENCRLRERLSKWENEELVGNTSSLTILRQMIDRVAGDGEVPVIINGESGSGKELVARAIHQQSPRSAAPFVAVNCGAVPESLFESELFGYKRGAFTGANTDKKGVLQSAHGGTLFLDEIGEMPLAMQVKFLRILQEQQVQPLGSTKSDSINIRVLAATHRDLRTMMTEGGFREDLYYRLAVVEMTVPPLRERTADIPLLLERFSIRFQVDLRFSKEAMGVLMAYDWPGNVRELENLVRRLGVTLLQGKVDCSDLPEHMTINSTGAELPKSEWPLEQPLPEASKTVMQRFESAYLAYHLASHNGNISHTAQAIGLSRVALHRKINQLGLKTVQK